MRERHSCFRFDLSARQTVNQPTDSPSLLTIQAGLPVGSGLSEKAAKELGLLPETAVGSAVIDAYAGWIGTVAALSTDAHDENPEETLKSLKRPALEESGHRLAAVAGTSTCHIVQSPEGVFVDGVWGPYKNAIFPGWWMNEGGQSSTGQLIDFMIKVRLALTSWLIGQLIWVLSLSIHRPTLPTLVCRRLAKSRTRTCLTFSVRSWRRCA